MRTVISPSASSAWRIQRATLCRGNAARCRSMPLKRGANCSESESWASAMSVRPRALALAVVGIDDLGDQRMPHHVGAGEVRDGNTAHAPQHALGVDQPAQLLLGQIDLAHVACYHRLGAEADAREKHLHLLDR